MLHPLFYKTIIEHIEKHLKDIYLKVIHSRPVKHLKQYELWETLDEEQKEEIIEFAEREISNSIARKMMAGAEKIPVPSIGCFKFSHYKKFVREEDPLEEESMHEFYLRAVEYAKKHRYKPNRIKSNEAAKSFAENLAKRKNNILQ